MAPSFPSMVRRGAALTSTTHGGGDARGGSWTPPAAFRQGLGMGSVPTADQFLERIRGNRRPAIRERRQPLGHIRFREAQDRRLGPRLLVVGGRHRVRLLRRAAHLRGGSRRLPPPGRPVHFHVTPVFVRPPEHEPPLHVPPFCCAPLRSVATDVHHRRIGADGVDDVQSGGTPRRACPLPTSGQANL